MTKKLEAGQIYVWGINYYLISEVTDTTVSYYSLQLYRNRYGYNKEDKITYIVEATEEPYTFEKSWVLGRISDIHSGWHLLKYNYAKDIFSAIQKLQGYINLLNLVNYEHNKQIVSTVYKEKE